MYFVFNSGGFYKDELLSSSELICHKTVSSELFNK